MCISDQENWFSGFKYAQINNNLLIIIKFAYKPFPITEMHLYIKQ